METPLVSILIPAFNSAAWIAETIESALAQSWPNKEIIVVDDGSSDETLNIARSYSERDVRVLTQENQGAAAARNMAFAHSTGEYIQWLDADDVLAPDKIETQMRAVQAGAGSRVLLSGAWAYFSYRRAQAKFVPTALWSNLSPVEWLLHKMQDNLHMQTDNWLVSRELTIAAGPWDVNLWRDNDGEYFCRVLLASDGVHFNCNARSYYRSAGFKSVSYINGADKKLISLCRSIKLHIGYLLSLEDSARTRSACIAYIGTWLYEFYPFRPDLVDELRCVIEELGGRFDEPRLSWKYQWIVRSFGWGAGRRAQMFLPRMRSTAWIGWDKAMHRAGL